MKYNFRLTLTLSFLMSSIAIQTNADVEYSCGLKPIPQVGCNIGDCINGKWQQVCTIKKDAPQGYSDSLINDIANPKIANVADALEKRNSRVEQINPEPKVNSKSLTYGNSQFHANHIDLQTIDGFREHLMDYREDLMNLAQVTGYNQSIDNADDVCSKLSLELEHIRDLIELSKSTKDNHALAVIRLREKNMSLFKSIELYIRELNLYSNMTNTNPSYTIILNNIKKEIRNIKDTLSRE